VWTDIKRLITQASRHFVQLLFVIPSLNTRKHRIHAPWHAAAVAM